MKSKKEVKALLLKQPNELTKEELSNLFAILCFKIKEYNRGEHQLFFEIHFRTTYLIMVRYPIVPAHMSFYNEFLIISGGCHGISMPGMKNMAELLNVFLNLFNSNILKDAGFEVYYNEECSAYSSKEEAEQNLLWLQEAMNEIEQSDKDKQKT